MDGQVLESILAVLTTTRLFWLLGATFVGIVAGVLPGVGASLTIALLIPLTFYMEKTTGLVILAAAWAGAVYGGSISSILINTPGTGANVATVLDGFPMARLGKAKMALGISATASMVGGLFGITCLILLGPLVARSVVLFGPAEYFLLTIFGFVVVSSSLSGSTIKGLASVCVGLLMCFIGIDIVTGYQRFTFGTMYLEDGIDFLVVVIGLFATAQVLKFLSETGAISETGRVEGRLTDGIKFTLKHPIAMLKAAALGTFFGFLPGIGTVSASLVAYGQARNASDNPDSFGKGNPMGVLVPETANNAVQGGALIPTLTFGIPGNSDSAVFLAGLMMYGLNPGRELFRTNVSVLHTLFVALIIAQVAFWVIGLLFTPVFTKVTLVPVKILVPIIWLIAGTGAFALRNDVVDCYFVLGFGVLGYAMSKFKYPIVPLMMGVMLGSIAEKNYIRSLILSNGSHKIFFEGYTCAVIWAAIAVSLLWPVVQRRRRAAMQKKKAAA